MPSLFSLYLIFCPSSFSTVHSSLCKYIFGSLSDVLFISLTSLPPSFFRPLFTSNQVGERHELTESCLNRNCLFWELCQGCNETLGTEEELPIKSYYAAIAPMREKEPQAFGIVIYGDLGREKLWGIRELHTIDTLEQGG